MKPLDRSGPAGYSVTMSTTTYSTLGAAIKGEADRRGMTITDLAGRIGWSQQRLSAWLRRESVKTADLQMVADALGLHAPTLVACCETRKGETR